MFNDDRPAEWIIAQLDYHEEDLRFGAHQENRMWAQWRYDNEVYGILSTGAGESMTDAAIVLSGTDGTIQVDADGGPMLELEQDDWREAIDVDGETIHAMAEPVSNSGRDSTTVRLATRPTRLGPVRSHNSPAGSVSIPPRFFSAATNRFADESGSTSRSISTTARSKQWWKRVRSQQCPTAQGSKSRCRIFLVQMLPVDPCIGIAEPFD